MRAVVDDDHLDAAPGGAERRHQLVVERPDVRRLVADRDDDRELGGHQYGQRPDPASIPRRIGPAPRSARSARRALTLARQRQPRSQRRARAANARTGCGSSRGSGCRRDRAPGRGTRQEGRPWRPASALPRRGDQWSLTGRRMPARMIGARLGAAGDEAVAEDGVGLEVHEVADLAVAVVEEADAAADVRLHGARAAERQQPDRRRDRRDAQLQVLLDLAAVVVDEVGVDAGHGAAGVADPGPELEELAERDQPLDAERRAVEVVDVERRATRGSRPARRRRRGRPRR